MAPPDMSLSRSVCNLMALVPYSSPSTHEFILAISSATRCFTKSRKYCVAADRCESQGE
jgi:hypothetical protein